MVYPKDPQKSLLLTKNDQCLIIDRDISKQTHKTAINSATVNQKSMQHINELTQRNQVVRMDNYGKHSKAAQL